MHDANKKLLGVKKHSFYVDYKENLGDSAFEELVKDFENKLKPKEKQTECKGDDKDQSI